ncbi:hypothetical protein SPHINGO8AM_80262 [Sphingomonas sp. 8AM]|nr:hypothetical protein SPHINGO8AM_80262 [Sphingomonas sp. 8AM]
MRRLRPSVPEGAGGFVHQVTHGGPLRHINDLKPPHLLLGVKSLQRGPERLPRALPSANFQPASGAVKLGVQRPWSSIRFAAVELPARATEPRRTRAGWRASPLSVLVTRGGAEVLEKKDPQRSRGGKLRVKIDNGLWVYFG